jgi:hypothetical protein
MSSAWLHYRASTIYPGALLSFDPARDRFLQVQYNPRHCAEACARMPHKCFQASYAQGVVDDVPSRSRCGIA